jgi:hypothetical protein
MYPVASRAIRAIGYDRVRRALFVDYVDARGRYRYDDVEPEVYAELLAAPSRGRFVNLRIKPNYRCRLLMPALQKANSRRRSGNS